MILMPDMVWGAVSMTAKVLPWSCTSCMRGRVSAAVVLMTCGSFSPRAWPHTEALPWGSVSMRMVFSRLLLAATAMCTAKVVLPDPPFCERKAIERIGLLGRFEGVYARMRALKHAYYCAGFNPSIGICEVECLWT